MLSVGSLPGTVVVSTSGGTGSLNEESGTLDGDDRLSMVIELVSVTEDVEVVLSVDTRFEIETGGSLSCWVVDGSGGGSVSLDEIVLGTTFVLRVLCEFVGSRGGSNNSVEDAVGSVLSSNEAVVGPSDGTLIVMLVLGDEGDDGVLELVAIDVEAWPIGNGGGITGVTVRLTEDAEEPGAESEATLIVVSGDSDVV